MKKNDFKEFKSVYLETCKDLIERDGSCRGMRCSKVCPFSCRSKVHEEVCCLSDAEVIISAKQYLELWEEKTKKSYLIFGDKLLIISYLKSIGKDYFPDNDKTPYSAIFLDVDFWVTSSIMVATRLNHHNTECINLDDFKKLFPKPEKIIEVEGEEYSEATLGVMARYYITHNKDN